MEKKDRLILLMFWMFFKRCGGEILGYSSDFWINVPGNSQKGFFYQKIISDELFESFLKPDMGNADSIVVFLSMLRVQLKYRLVIIGGTNMGVARGGPCPPPPGRQIFFSNSNQLKDYQ